MMHRFNFFRIATFPTKSTRVTWRIPPLYQVHSTRLLHQSFTLRIQWRIDRHIKSPSLWHGRSNVTTREVISLGSGEEKILFKLMSIAAKAIFILCEKIHILFIFQTRIAVLSCLFAPVVVSFSAWKIYESAAVLIHSRLIGDGHHPRVESSDSWQIPVRWIHWLIWSIEMAGPTFTKIGQWASSRLDLFPEEICLALAKLQSNARAHSFQDTIHILESTYKKPLHEVFSDLDEVPIGVGALAQVYKARLVSSNGKQGKEVAVKVVHPLAHETIAIDLAILEAIAKTITYLIPSSQWLSFPEEVRMFGSMMKDQSCMLREAKYLDMFRHNFDDEEWEDVIFPKPEWNLCADQVLVEEFVHGIPMRNVMALGPCIFDKEIAKIGLTSFLKMLVLDNHVHADMHPGNMMLSFINKETGEAPSPSFMQSLSKINTHESWTNEMDRLYSEGYSPRVVIIDTGLVSSLSPNHLENFLDLFRAVVDFNGNRISQLMIERSATPWTVIDPSGFSATMTSFLSRVRDQTLALKQFSVAEILAFVLNNVRKHHVKIEGDFANVAISIMLVEGMGRRLDPDADLLKAAVPFLSRLVSSNLSKMNQRTLSWKEWVLFQISSWNGAEPISEP